MNKLFFSTKNIFIFLFVFFLLTRLYNLTLLPIFTDESVYIYWGKYIVTYNSNWFMSLTAGDPPLFIWLVVPLLKLFPQDLYLFAGRLVSVIAGGITIFGIYKLSLLLFEDKKTGLLAVFLYIINPFMLFYDRLALYDSLLSAMLIWTVYYTLITSRTLAKKHAFLWGIFLGLGLLTKSSAIIFLALTPICFFFLLDRQKSQNLKKILFLPFFAVVIAWLLYSVQMLSVNYQAITDKTDHFRVPLNTFLSSPFIIINTNLSLIFNWIVSYYTLPVLFIGCIGFLIILKKHFTKGFILLLLWLVPIVVFASIGKIIFPRYILFTTPYFLIGFAQALRIISSYKRLYLVQILIIVLTFVVTWQFNNAILIDPSKAPLPVVDYNQYISDKPSGYGLDTIFKFLDKELDQGPRITLITQGKFGLFPYAFMLKYWNDKRITIVQSNISRTADVDIYGFQKSTKVYVVFWENENIPKSLPLRLVMKAEKPGGKNPILLAAPK